MMVNVPDHLGKALNDMVLRRLAGEATYQRGLDYFSHGHVESLEDRGGNVYAVVRGSQDYAVTLSGDDGVIDYTCDCPVGSDGFFCKHCVAAALAWLNRAAKPPRTGRAKTKRVTLADARKILQAEDKDTLVRMLLDWAQDDDRLHERIILYAARRSGPETGAAAVRRAFESAVRIKDFVASREATRWARGVHAAIDSIEQLLSDGQAAAVIHTRRFLAILPLTPSSSACFSRICISIGGGLHSAIREMSLPYRGGGGGATLPPDTVPPATSPSSSVPSSRLNSSASGLGVFS
jgi:SWIM zinc finger